MPTDLTAHRDHPAAILERRGADDGLSVYAAAAVGASATFLRKYERLNGVTFAALDNDTLTAVREAYAAAEAADDVTDFLSALRDLSRAVRDLLGLDD